MSRKQSNLKTGLVAGLVGLGIGALGAFIGSQLLKEEEKPEVPSPQYQLPPRKKRENIFKEKNESVEHSPSFEQTLECPISQEVMEDPVTITDCGHSFDRKHIVPVLEKYHICPLCRKPTNTKSLVPNYQLKNVISHYQSTRR